MCGPQHLGHRPSPELPLEGIGPVTGLEALLDSPFCPPPPLCIQGASPLSPLRISSLAHTEPVQVICLYRTTAGTSQLQQSKCPLVETQSVLLTIPAGEKAVSPRALKSEGCILLAELF